MKYFLIKKKNVYWYGTNSRKKLGVSSRDGEVKAHVDNESMNFLQFLLSKTAHFPCKNKY